MEMRLKNIMTTGDMTVNELDMSSLGMKECLEAVRDGADWKNKKGKLPKGKGIGSACGFFVSGAGYPIYRSDTYHSTVVIKMSEDGGVATVLTGSAEIGQGSDTTMAMIAAETLGIPLECVKVVSGDTDLSVDLGAYSSRQTLMTGHATKEAAEQVRAKIAEFLAEEMACDTSSITFSDGKVLLRRSGRGFPEDPYDVYQRASRVDRSSRRRLPHFPRGCQGGVSQGRYSRGDGQVQTPATRRLLQGSRCGHIARVRLLRSGGGGHRGPGNR